MGPSISEDRVGSSVPWCLPRRAYGHPWAIANQTRASARMRLTSTKTSRHRRIPLLNQLALGSEVMLAERL